MSNDLTTSIGAKKSKGIPSPPMISDSQIITDMILENGLEMDQYLSLVKLVNEGSEFTSWLKHKFTQPFSDDPEGLYVDLEELLLARDYLTTQAARAVALYRASKKRFLPSTGTSVDKEATIDHKASPYKFYEYATEERIRTLDNRCTAAKQQQRILEEALKRNLIVPD